VCVIVCVCDCECVCVCSCVCQRENDREREKTRERKKKRDREYVFAGMHVCAWMLAMRACDAHMYLCVYACTCAVVKHRESLRENVRAHVGVYAYTERDMEEKTS